MLERIKVIREHLDHIEAELEQVDNITCEECSMFRSCLICNWFDGQNDNDICGKFGARPPARIIVYGCNDFKEIEPPKKLEEKPKVFNNVPLPPYTADDIPF